MAFDLHDDLCPQLIGIKVIAGILKGGYQQNLINWLRNLKNSVVDPGIYK